MKMRIYQNATMQYINLQFASTPFFQSGDITKKKKKRIKTWNEQNSSVRASDQLTKIELRGSCIARETPSVAF